MASGSGNRATRYCSHPLPAADIAETGKQLKAVTDELETLELEWLELSEQLEQASV
jgi:ATP-binding cassette subfamily F protein 3